MSASAVAGVDLFSFGMQSVFYYKLSSETPGRLGSPGFLPAPGIMRLEALAQPWHSPGEVLDQWTLHRDSQVTGAARVRPRKGTGKGEEIQHTYQAGLSARWRPCP